MKHRDLCVTLSRTKRSENGMKRLAAWTQRTRRDSTMTENGCVTAGFLRPHVFENTPAGFAYHRAGRDVRARKHALKLVKWIIVQQWTCLEEARASARLFGETRGASNRTGRVKSTQWCAVCGNGQIYLLRDSVTGNRHSRSPLKCETSLAAIPAYTCSGVFT